MREDRDLLVGLDIGTSKVTCLVARLREDGGVEPIGLGVAPMTGMKRGAVVNIEASVAAIAQAVDEAKRMAACDIPRVHASISGAHIQCTNAEGMLAVKGSEITREDVVKVIEVARAMPIPSEQQVLHLLTQEFIIDVQGGIKDPVGMSGVKLVAKVHIITGAAASAQNIIKCVRRAGLESTDSCCNRSLRRTPPHRGRKEPGRVHHRHRRRHHRPGGLHPGGDSAHGRASGRRRHDHQRHRHGAAHAHGRGRDDQARTRCGAPRLGRSRGDDRSRPGGRTVRRGVCRASGWPT